MWLTEVSLSQNWQKLCVLCLTLHILVPVSLLTKYASVKVIYSALTFLRKIYFIYASPTLAVVTACFWQFSLMLSDLADDFPCFRRLHSWLMYVRVLLFSVRWDAVLNLLELLKVCSERSRLYMYKNVFSHKGVNIFLYKSRHKRTSNATGPSLAWSPSILVFDSVGFHFFTQRCDLFVFFIFQHRYWRFVASPIAATSSWIDYLCVCFFLCTKDGFWKRKFNLYFSMKILLKHHRLTIDVYTVTFHASKTSQNLTSKWLYSGKN